MTYTVSGGTLNPTYLLANLVLFSITQLPNLNTVFLSASVHMIAGPD